MTNFFLFLALMSGIAQADLSVSVGTGKGILDVPGTHFERVGALGYQLSWGDFFLRPEVGFFGDLSGRGRSSFWIVPLIGVRALSRSGPELHIAGGPGYLQNPDEILGGHFQFSLEGGGGIMDASGKVYIGVAWKHLSSAGIEMPNQGRDFIMIQLRLMGF